jgi:hypothetical protein
LMREADCDEARAARRDCCQLTPRKAVLAPVNTTMSPMIAMFFMGSFIN